MTSFGHVIIHAIRGNKQPLYDYLLSPDQPLGMAEREFLVHYLKNAKRGRPEKQSVLPTIRFKAVIEYNEKKELGIKAESIAKDICTRLSVRRSTFYNWVDEFEKLLNQFKDKDRDLIISALKSSDL